MPSLYSYDLRQKAIAAVECGDHKSGVRGSDATERE